MMELMIFPAIWIWAMFAITCHEMAHWLVGWLVGFRGLKLNVGRGPIAWKGKFGHVALILRWLPFGGLFLATWSSAKCLRWRGVLFALAGPLCDVALLALLWRLRWDFGRGAVEDWWASVEAQTAISFLLFYQGLMLLQNLLPSEYVVDGVKRSSDGRMAWDFLSGKLHEESGQTGQVYGESIQRYDGEFEVASSWLHDADEDLRVTYQEALEHLVEGEHAAAIAGLKQVRLAAQMSKGEEAALLDQMASVVAIQGRLEFLAEALVWAREAVALCPEAPTLRGTLGSLLVLDGQHTEALPLLLPLTAEEAEPIDRAIAYAYLALVYQHFGRERQAHEALRTSLNLDASQGVAERIAKQLWRERDGG